MFRVWLLVINTNHSHSQIYYPIVCCCCCCELWWTVIIPWSATHISHTCLAYFFLYFYCSNTIFVITMKEKRQRRVTFFLPAIILMLIYFFSFIPVNVNCLSRTHTYTQPSLTTRRQTGPYGALLFLFFLLELSYGFLSLSIYIHSQLFFFCPILFFFLFAWIIRAGDEESTFASIRR